MQITAQERVLVNVLNDSRYQFLFFSLLLYLLCVYEYEHFVFSKYEYMGFRNSFTFIKAVLAFFLFTSSCFLVFVKTSPFIKGLTALLNVVYVLPIMILFQYDSGGWLFVISALLLLVIINLNFTLKLFRSAKIKENEVPIMLGVLSIFILLPFILSYKVNLDLSIFLLDEKVYAIREAIQDDGNLFTGYMKSPLIQVILPLLAIYGLKERKVFFTFLAIALTILVYSMIPQKSIFLGIFVVVFFYFFKDPLRKVSVFTGLLLMLCLFGFVLTWSFDNMLIESLILRRYLMVPALLNHYYYEFFESNYIYYSHSFLKNVFDYPYELGPTYMVAEYAYGKTTTNANNGFASDAFMNLGYVGVFIYTLIVGLIIKFFDALSIDAKFFGLFFLFVNLLRSSGLATIMLTHGLWLFMLLAYVVLRQKRQSTEQINI